MTEYRIEWAVPGCAARSLVFPAGDAVAELQVRDITEGLRRLGRVVTVEARDTEWKPASIPYVEET